MFGFEPEEAQALGSAGRYEARIKKFEATGSRYPRIVHYFWWVLHNVGAHGFLAVAPCKYAFRFHDWSSKKLNAQ